MQLPIYQADSSVGRVNQVEPQKPMQ